MLLPVIPSNNLQLLLKFDVLYREPIDLNIVGFDADNNKAVFFNRLANPKVPGTYPLEFPMPITPKNLYINFSNDTNKRNENAYQIQSLKCDLLPQNPVALDKEDIEFYEFIKWFAENANHFGENTYVSANGKFKIKYVNDIITGPGEYDNQDRPIPPGIKLTTPARTDHNSGVMEVARSQVRHFTVPIIVVILEHERAHFKHDSADETFCDLEALRICLGKGFPKTELIHAFTNIFSDSKENIDRINHIINFIDNYQYAA